MAETFTAPVKDPAAVLDYTFDWSDWLVGGDTISTSTWTAEDGITVDSNSKTSTTTTVWLSGGTAAESYRVVNHIVTAGGRTDERTLAVPVENR